MAAWTSPFSREASGHGGDGEVLGRDVGELLPVQRRRHRRAGLGTDAVGRGDRAVASVLVEVDEDPGAALLLPPARRHLVGQAPFQRAGEGDGGVADVDEGPARLEAGCRCGSRGRPRSWESRCSRARTAACVLRRPPRGVGEVGPGLGVEVKAQLVGVIGIGAAHRPRVKGDRAHLARPGDDGQLGGADLVGVAARRELDARRLDVLRRPLGHALLVEGVAAAAIAGGEHDARVHALGPALERRRPLAQGAHDAVADAHVVADDVALGHLRPYARSRGR